MSEGIVYILTNEAMPDYIKIGITESDVIDRIKSLDNTSLPLPFECFYAGKVSDHKKVEKLLHDAFDDHRVRSSREFFTIAPERAKAALLIANPIDVTPREEQIIETNEDKLAIKETRKRKSNKNFEMLGVPVGAVLTFSKDHNITCTVIDSKRVRYQDKELSVSASALEVLRQLGYDWQTVNGWSHWCYKGEPLDSYFE